MNCSNPFGDLPRGHYGAIYADPPWQFKTLWGTATGPGNRNADYQTMDIPAIGRLPVADLAADDCVLFMWGIWILMPQAFDVIKAWGFEYKTCAFSWMKARGTQPDFFRDEIDVQFGLGYWTRANSEVCLLATRGRPKRLNANVRQGIIEPRRAHSRKPDCVPRRIERLVAGPYIELFARTTRPCWDSWGDQTDRFAPVRPYDEAVDAIGSYTKQAGRLQGRLQRRRLAAARESLLPLFAAAGEQP